MLNTFMLMLTATDTCYILLLRSFVGRHFLLFCDVSTLLHSDAATTSIICWVKDFHTFIPSTDKINCSSRTGHAGTMLNKSRTIRNIFYNHFNTTKPTSSEVLTSYIKQCNEPPWTSYFVKYSDIKDDQWGKSHFNWIVGSSNYHILRTGCFPYIKYHCTKRNSQDLTVDDYFFRIIKVTNLGLPCLAYGIAAIFLIKHTETVHTNKGNVNIHFLYPEDKGSCY